MTIRSGITQAGAAISAQHRLLSVENQYPNDAANGQLRVWEFWSIILNQYPDILSYTNQALNSRSKGTPYEETFDTYNYS